MKRKLNPTRPTVPEVQPLVNAYLAKPGNEAGGSLHIVLDDENADDDSIEPVHVGGRYGDQ